MDQFYSFIKEEDEDGSIFYLFVTRYNFVYAVYFKVDEYSDYVENFPLLLQKGFAFGFRKNSLNDSQYKRSEDAQVFTTMYHIIKDFFKANGNETVLLYHCDSADGRQFFRSKLFDKWQRQVEETNFERHAINVSIADKDFYLGFITLTDNPSINQLREEFEAFSYFIIQPKNE
ncbi:DUF6169 family protein [Mucilaginibacter pedocola]|uniref:Uncharacterized protein n=1 Tax=Mucilaginibacter pedocola TaxID=1792845 RepID=A0A1S9PJP3_9SPHI|nr:DUF6169 family protein [Mucilaginibacter pedocola]OOQ61155.1 hypothetical protein BC343_22195 [Mucilaginibacter pedocola]